MLLVLAVLGAAGWVLLGSKLLVVRHVEVSGTRLVPRDRLVAEARIRLGLPMARLDTDAVRDRVRGVREVESAEVRRVWPGTVRIEVRERTPVVAVERSGRYFSLDRFGMTVVDSPERPALPVLSVGAPGPDDPATRAALGVIGELPDGLARRLTGVEATSPESVTLRLGGERSGDQPLTVVWGAPGRAAEKGRLVDALRRTSAGRTARMIDVSSPEVVTTR
ncbi:cell division protein FtsQ [Thermomonospora umbrina]|uniref:Cell division protein FtsQ n=2 Tax=Thermomonospora umbrina TaxID=111806 RepID=A0A3D9T7E0_9ACTN|nr:cell division protein FtsQ [Thermomonospora umbrina]